MTNPKEDDSLLVCFREELKLLPKKTYFTLYFGIYNLFRQKI